MEHRTPRQVILAESPEHPLLDHLKLKLKLKNDAALSRALEVAPPVISKIRWGRLAFGPKIQIKAHELTNMTFDEIRGFLVEAQPK